MLWPEFYFQASNEALQDTSSSSSYSFTAHEDKLFITQSLAPKSQFSNYQTFDFSKDFFENWIESLNNNLLLNESF